MLAPGRLPLSAADWALVPPTCLGIERALPAALACSPRQAAQVVRRVYHARSRRLRAAALCLSRRGLPGHLAARILAQVALPLRAFYWLIILLVRC